MLNKFKMSNLNIVCASIIVLVLFQASYVKSNTDDETLKELLDKYDAIAVKKAHDTTLASWNVATDIGNAEKNKDKEAAILDKAAFEKDWWTNHWSQLAVTDVKDNDTRRQLDFLKKLGDAVLDTEDLSTFTKVTTKMSTVYNKATVCPYEDQQCSMNAKNRLALDPEIADRLAVSRDSAELEYLWHEWHENSGKLMREDFKENVRLMNEIGRGNGYNDAAAYWQDEFEDPNFEENIEKLWVEVQPLYDELFTYMRYKLIEIYGDEVRKSPNIPAHLLGNMWGQSWANLYDDTKPFKIAASVDVTERLKKSHNTPRKMFELADDFFGSLGLESNKMSYTGESIIEKPKDRIIQCHASAWNFYDGKDYRIKMCTNINLEDLITIHHEMGHIQYYIQYKHLPKTLQRGANPAFHEAIGDTIALSVANPHHLKAVGLMDAFNDTVENDINALYAQALERVAFLPFGLIVDKWRWNVFNGQVNETAWNNHWWELRGQYQRLSPPRGQRGEEYFDPGAKFHIPANSKYISYFIAHILEFQLYRSLCTAAKQYELNNPKKPLHKCDFYGSKDAGRQLADGLKLGASKHWSDVLEVMTHERAISAVAIKEYFNPLYDFLKEENKRLAREDELRGRLQDFNTKAEVANGKLQIAEWNHITDLKNKTKTELREKAVREYADFDRQQHDNFKDEFGKVDAISDDKLRRQMLKIKNLGVNALSSEQLSELSDVKAEMEKIYNEAQFCNYFHPNCSMAEEMTLNPEITHVMATSQNHSELLYTWTMWHNKTGPPMRKPFKRYVELSNEAAKLNNFSDYGEMWRDKFEDPNFVKNMLKIWEQVEPLYDELHTYTRRKLLNIYGKQMNESDSLIPAHLLGNMWGQSWDNLYKHIKPYKGDSDIDITASLQANNFTALHIFEEADRFYKSMGLESNAMSYNSPSIIEKPNDTLIVCHASAWDFSNSKDFRIKQCATVDQENFITAHHEMGHIQYYILYKDQPFVFREGANPGFHEAVGDLIAISASTPHHLSLIKILHDYKDTKEDNINALFKMALKRVAFLPFGLLLDLYRYDVFSGKVDEFDWNKYYEELREKYQKIRSPTRRNEKFFDAGAKFHVPGDTQYMSYFVAHILEFQFFKALCLEANQYEPNNPSKPLHKCDIYGSKAAGNRLRAGLSLGSSVHWSEALSRITNGDGDISADALLEYFQPLHEYLKQENGTGSLRADHLPYIIGGCVIVACLIALIGCIIYKCSKNY